MNDILTDEALDLILREARTHKHWLLRDVPDSLLADIYDLAKLGPTSNNSLPMRVVFVRSKEAKERLKPALMKGNVEKTMSAPATAIIAYDEAFYDKLPQLSPQSNARDHYARNPAAAEETAFRNGTLQGAYLMIAARALGLDCGPMSGFSRDKVDEAFFAGSSWRSNFLCNLGYGDPSRLHPRGARLAFDEACRIE